MANFLFPDAYEVVASSLGVSMQAAVAILTIVGIWSLVWKGFALWKSARRNSMVWFIVLLLINTAGILEILYIFVFSELGKAKRSKHPRPVKKSSKKR